MLDESFQKNHTLYCDIDFTSIVVKGNKNLLNLQQEGDTWKVRLIEDELHKQRLSVERI